MMDEPQKYYKRVAQLNPGDVIELNSLSGCDHVQWYIVEKRSHTPEFYFVQILLPKTLQRGRTINRRYGLTASKQWRVRWFPALSRKPK